jgi:tripartite-type tricarboxylate transporter receptor subunit TctC
MNCSRQFMSVLAAVSVMTLMQSAGAQSFDPSRNFPDRPIKILVPISAGSAVDIVARVVGGKMGDILGQRLYVENQPGAAGIIAMRAGGRAAPDGYTITMVNGSLVTTVPNIKKDVGYDPFNDFAPISELVKIPLGLISSPAFPATSVIELVNLARQKPGAINYGSGGVGSPQHIAMELFARAAGVQLTHVPYRSVSGAINGIMAGDISVMFTAMSAVVPLLSSKRARLLAISTPARVAQFQNVPTAAEAGVPGFNFVEWCAFLAPANTPQEIVAKLHDAAVVALKDPTVQSRLIELGFEIEGSTPEQLASIMRQDFAQNREVIRVGKFEEQ